MAVPELSWDNLDEVAEMRDVRLILEQVSVGLRNIVAKATKAYVIVEEKYNKDELPAGADTLWASDREELVTIGQNLVAWAAWWDTHFPQFADPNLSD